MLIVAGFLAPYVVAMAAFPLLVQYVRRSWVVTLGSCILIVSSPWLIPADEPFVRFIASISAAVVAIKFIDASRDVQRACGPTWREFMAFLANPFTYVRRSLARERRPSWRENSLTVLLASGA
jgi:hypothetical protein